MNPVIALFLGLVLVDKVVGQSEWWASRIILAGVLLIFTAKAGKPWKSTRGGL